MFCFSNHCVRQQIPLLQARPQLKQCVRQSIERAVQELVHPVVDRSIKIAMTTCEQIVRKDFALDSEESRMRVAAHHMMRNLTAGMAMITCREPLLMSIATNLKNSFAAALRVGSRIHTHPVLLHPLTTQTEMCV